jgi:hypothetical protein
MRKIVLVLMLLSGIVLLSGCTLSLDLHPEGKTPASSK